MLDFVLKAWFQIDIVLASLLRVTGSGSRGIWLISRLFLRSSLLVFVLNVERHGEVLYISLVSLAASGSFASDRLLSHRVDIPEIVDLATERGGRTL